MIGEELLYRILNRKLGEVLTPQLLASILTDMKGLLDQLIADPATLAALADRLKSYLGV